MKQSALSRAYFEAVGIGFVRSERSLRNQETAAYIPHHNNCCALRRNPTFRFDSGRDQVLRLKREWLSLFELVGAHMNLHARSSNSSGHQ